MKSTITIASACAVIGLLTCPASAHAQNNTARIGLYAVFYHTAADDVTGPFTPPGLSADVSNVQTLYLAYIRRLSPRFDLELSQDGAQIIERAFEMDVGQN